MDRMPPIGEGPLKQCPLDDFQVAGFSAAGVAAGIKKNGRPDLALVTADRAVPAAGVFTQNRVAAAPVEVCRSRLAAGLVRGILVNSGCANAATGGPGLEACLAACRAAAREIGCPEEQILMGSTGVIGQLLPVEKIEAALPGLARELSPQGFAKAARAIMTTDTFPKMARADLTLGGKKVTVAGFCKGAGMIRPDMATMLAFVFTDAAVNLAALRGAVAQAADLSFNRATVDGDTSTNDTLLLLAGGAAGNPELGVDDPELPAFTAAVTKVCQELAAMMVADGEGSGHLIGVLVEGAESPEQARATAYAIAHSPLVKTAFTGGDPNWGRIISTAGAEAARGGYGMNSESTDLWIGEALVAKDGMWTGQENEDLAVKVMARPRYTVRLDLGLGRDGFWVLTSDLTKEYIEINADYRS